MRVGVQVSISVVLCRWEKPGSVTVNSKHTGLMGLICFSLEVKGRTSRLYAVVLWGGHELFPESLKFNQNVPLDVSLTL